MFVFFNNQILRAEEAKISALSSAALYGSGVFTTVAIYNRKPFQWEKHWRRLTENAEKINLRLSVDFTAETIYDALLEIIEQNDLNDGRARLTFFDERGGGVWSFENSRRVSILIMTADFRSRPEDLKLTLSPFFVNSKSPLANIKSCGGYLENLLALEEAKNRGFDEAVRLNESGQIVSACMANLFWVKDDALYTPALETGCLAGTTRSLIIETAKEIGLEVYTISEVYGELRLAEEIFMTSTGVGIAGVRRLDGETYNDRVTNLLQNEFSAKILAASR